MSTSDNRAKLILTFEALKQALKLPEDAEIFGIEMTQNDLSKSQFRIFVRHPDLPKWNEGMEVITAIPTFKHEYAPPISQFEGWGL